jgi:hypothetical protein
MITLFMLTYNLYAYSTYVKYVLYVLYVCMYIILYVQNWQTEAFFLIHTHLLLLGNSDFDFVHAA